jgi:3-hydroxyisobutyrate dehydrogenase
MDIGFIGLGVMGQPMALNLVHARTSLVVWNRSPDKCEALRAAGAKVVTRPADVFIYAQIVIVMLFDSAVIDSVLGRGTPDFVTMVAGHTIINTSSTSPAYSRGLEADVRAAGGRYVEAPVSGSKVPAETGQLVAMLAGEQAIVEEVGPLLQPMCREAIFCGPVGNALLMKLSVNLFLMVLVAGLAEAVHFADRQGLNLMHLQAVLDAGPMASSVSRLKIAKMISRDFTVQAGISDAWNSTRLIAEAASNANIWYGLLDLSQNLYGEAAALCHEELDMAAVLRAIEVRTDALTENQ